MSNMWMCGLSISVATLWAQASAAAPPVQKAAGPCAKSAVEAQQQVEAGQLRRARATFTECAKASCGTMSLQCRSGLQQLDSDTPSVVPLVTDGGAAQAVDVSVSMDGELLTSKLDGRSLYVDPGWHEFSFSTPQGDVQRERILILQGQRNRVISVTLKRATPTPSDTANASAAQPAPPLAAATTAAAKKQPLAPPARRPREVAASDDTERPRASPALAYVVGGVGLAAVGSSLLLAHWGREDNLLLDRCAPNCKKESIDHVSNMYIAADITLAAGVVALGAATWLYLARPGVEDDVEDKRAATYHFAVQPTASGAYASLSGAF